MLCIFAGRPGVGGLNLDAKEVQTSIEGQVAAVEHSATIQQRKSGSYTLAFTLDPTTNTMKKSGEVRDNTASEVMFSPRARKVDGSPLTIDDFPEDFQFGNGVTCGRTLKLKDGSMVTISWVVFPTLSRPGVMARFTTLRQLMES